MFIRHGRRCGHQLPVVDHLRVIGKAQAIMRRPSVKGRSSTPRSHEGCQVKRRGPACPAIPRHAAGYGLAA
ncbi:protein of unknown function [Methylocaldum szegediense]|uniref:Uncharacterized protein n=1 Tax=Methylocaldum szegediense TaxID=73780 RepID=A0ABM9I160_9GAMM|nr:protein of unknown function [Methylocaldum szegediense]